MFDHPEANMQTLPTQDREPSQFWRSRYGIGWLVLAGIAGWFLWTEHRAHLFGAIPGQRERQHARLVGGRADQIGRASCRERVSSPV